MFRVSGLFSRLIDLFALRLLLLAHTSDTKKKDKKAPSLLSLAKAYVHILTGLLPVDVIPIGFFHLDVLPTDFAPPDILPTDFLHCGFLLYGNLPIGLSRLDLVPLDILPTDFLFLDFLQLDH